MHRAKGYVNESYKRDTGTAWFHVGVFLFRNNGETLTVLDTLRGSLGSMSGPQLKTRVTWFQFWTRKACLWRPRFSRSGSNFRESPERTITWPSRARHGARLARGERDSSRRRRKVAEPDRKLQLQQNRVSGSELRLVGCKCWRSGNSREINKLQTWWEEKLIFISANRRLKTELFRVVTFKTERIDKFVESKFKVAFRAE